MSTAGVPTSEMLRQSALRASWRRDRRVGRRKVAWRWGAWGFTRWVLPVLVALAFGYIPATSHGGSQAAVHWKENA